MDPTELKSFLEENPKAREILRLAVEVEERDSQKQQWGWEWSDVRAHPASLMKLVIAGVIRVASKSNRYTFYMLMDRPTVKKTLGLSR